MKNHLSLVPIFLFISIFSCNLPLPDKSRERQPAFKGMTFPEYLKKNIKYPAIEREEGKEGVVYISFVVEEDGSISNVRPAKEVKGAPGFTKEAMRVIKTMPDWTPGMMYGIPVRVELKQPVRFVLQ